MPETRYFAEIGQVVKQAGAGMRKEEGERGKEI
jgi:hypothetical protein